jgi:hypothetical protein
VIHPLTQAVGMHYDGYVSVNSFDLRGGTAGVEVVKASTGGADTIFAIGADANNFFRFLVHTPGASTNLARMKGPDGLERPFDAVTPQLLFQVNIAGHLETLPIAYDPVQHRFMRFRIDAVNSTVFFETSPDNVDFTPQLQRTISLTVGSALTAELSAGTSNPTNPGLTVFDNLTVITSTFQFSATGYSVNESDGAVQVTVTRSGLTANAGTVDFATMDGTAHQSSKYLGTAGRLTFAAGQASKSFTVLIEDNGLSEGNETVNLVLTNPVGSGLNSPGRSLLTIVDNDTTNGPNPLDSTAYFVQQQYLDFLNRVPDAAGLAFWANQITSCGTNAGCIEGQRVNTSGAFFLSIEFQQTGYLVEKLYKAAYGDGSGSSFIGGVHQLSVPIIRFGEFLPDTQEIGAGVVVGQTGWEAALENNKVAFMTEFVQRLRFTSGYLTTLTPAQYVDKLFTNTGVTPTTADRTAAINEFGAATNTNDVAARGRALRRVAENVTLNTQEFNRAFVLMQYYGYLRRDPNSGPDTDYAGYDFWLAKLNQFKGDFLAAEMVKAFLSSNEYRGRFGP